MKKYLFGLGAMLVGAGLMFVLMHGEVSAKVFGDKMDDEKVSILGGMTAEEFVKRIPQPFYCSEYGRKFKSGVGFKGQFFPMHHCRTKNMTCAVFLGQTGSSVSCVKR